MTKAELIEKIAKDVKILKTEAGKVLNSFFNGVTNGLKKKNQRFNIIFPRGGLIIPKLYPIADKPPFVKFTALVFKNKELACNIADNRKAVNLVRYRSTLYTFCLAIAVAFSVSTFIST